MSAEGATNGILTRKVNDLLKRLADSEDRRKAGQNLLAKLAAYATHSPTCVRFDESNDPKSGACDCGLFELLKKCTKL